MLKHFINTSQLNTLHHLAATSEEAEYFVQKLQELEHLFESMPRVYEQEEKGDNAVIYLHYFRGNQDAWITERDTTDEQLQAFGLIDLGMGPEIGYIPIKTLIENNFELDLYWQPITLKELKGTITS